MLGVGRILSPCPLIGRPPPLLAPPHATEPLPVALMPVVHLTAPPCFPFPPPLVPCQNGETPLHKAAGKGRTDAVEVLLAAGADKDIADKVSRSLAAPTVARWRQG